MEDVWTLTQCLENKINAFEMWLYSGMQRVSWRDYVTNVEVLRRMGTDCQILYCEEKETHIFWTRHEKWEIPTPPRVNSGQD